jgi:cysteine sulfinate desulfinase/cysteine desulfurase-like protein
MIMQGLAGEGDHVVTTMLEHNSVLRPLYHLTQSGIIETTHVPFDPMTGYVDPEDIRKAIRKNTRFVVVNHCSNVIGTYSLLPRLGKSAKKPVFTLLWTAARVPALLKLTCRQWGSMRLFSPAISA